ncbi:MAG: hypothetical protein GXO74_05265 [Calditrichaeota bacterium]|nr:hypothetical protein [Calditrichota bacterium]
MPKFCYFYGYEDVNMRYLGEQYPEEESGNDAASRLIRDRHSQLAHHHRIFLVDGNERRIAGAQWTQ